MFSKKLEYQPLDCDDYIIRQRSTTRIVLSCLVIIHLMVLMLWAFTLTENSETDKNVAPIHEVPYDKESLVFIETDIFKDYTDDSPAWESKDKCPIPNDNEKFDCFPEAGGNEELCTKRGCCWEPKLIKTTVGVPWCYYPKSYEGYMLVNKTRSKNGMRAFLSLTLPSPYPDDIKLIRLDVQHQSSHRLHVKIIDANSNRYEPPYPDIPVVFESHLGDPVYQVKVNSNGFKVLRNDGDMLFDCERVGGFIFADQFLQISARFTGKIYGLGQHESTLPLDTNWTKFTLFNHDGDPQPNANLYGSHPFYLVVEPSGKSHGVFFHNSNGMDVLLQPLPAVTFRSIGGVFDFYFFMGPTPADVIKQYTEVIGRTFFPPYWALGFHLSRFGYKNISELRAVWKRNRVAGIPFDTQWNDLDYMFNRNDFTFDKKRYKELPKFVNELHEAGMHYIPIVDPGISGCEPNGTYPPFDEGLVMDIFIKNLNGSLFFGKVWNSKCTVFPDFTARNAGLYWSKQIRNFHALVPFDGIWIDMNEPSNFLDGSFNGCPSNKWEDPVYVPDVLGGKLRSKTICMSTRQYAGLHYNLHNLYGLTEAIATYRALQELGKRPFIISRSTYPGSGKFTGHWSGDVMATWHAMKKSIAQMLSFNLFGIPMTGADICGFDGNTTALLCQRWSQLGAFYPFSRNHNSDDCIDQDPVAFGDAVVNSTKKALTVRYTLLPYLYTLFFKAHTEGETVARPLFFEFWSDPRTHTLDESFLWGCCVLIVPVLKEYATTVPTYLPSAIWYDWYTGLGVGSNGTEVVLHAPSDTIPVFIRGGAILPTQAPNVTTTLSRLNDIDLIAAFNASLRGTGSFYWDDGESRDTFQTGEFGVVEFALTPANLTSHVNHWGYREVPQLGSIKILGFIKPIKKLYFNGKEVQFIWNPTSLILTVRLKHPLNLPFTLQWKLIGE